MFINTTKIALLSIISLGGYFSLAYAGSNPLPEPQAYPVQCSADGTQATISWKHVPETDTYALRVDDIQNNEVNCTDGWFCDTGVDYLDNTYLNTSYTITNLIPNQTYRWWVHAKYEDTWAGVSDWTKREFVCENTLNSDLSSIQIDNQVRSTTYLLVRREYGIHQSIIGLAYPGTVGKVLAGPRYADGYQWYLVSYNNGLLGWSADNWLARI